MNPTPPDTKPDSKCECGGEFFITCRTWDYKECFTCKKKYPKTFDYDTKPICQNCRFWKHELYSFGTCLSPKLGDIYSDEPIADNGFQSKHSDLETGKDFGCIHFEKKD